ncbi:MAG: DUF1904 family protein [Sedimentibacter sp.]|uniref:DUF1904 family protein n=1 Tax=Sedimentibacter sp. TaxID=1960295 RepID=UPI002980A36A|nr:DUF1904 family protein [Sedimentibacter sp.]MDW5298885.1 DUF1904 family protein [Sedimentibacter sp.]
MPALKLKSIDAKKALAISKDLIDELQELIQCPRDYFSMELVQSSFIFDGEFVEGPPAVDLFWFDRGQEVQDKTAKIITKYINSIGYESVDVIFHSLEESKYYENGKHF